MKSLLKHRTIESKTLNKDVELVELCYAAQMQIMEAHSNGKPSEVGPIMIKYGVVEFAESTVDEIATMLPLPVVVELSEAVAEHSALDEDKEKKLESAQK